MNGRGCRLQFLEIDHIMIIFTARAKTCGSPKEHPEKVSESPEELTKPGGDHVCLLGEDQPSQLKGEWSRLKKL